MNFRSIYSKPTLYRFLICLLFFSCQPQKEATSNAPSVSNTDPKANTSTCTTEGLVDDLTGLDGCGLVLLVNGEKWMPINLSEQKMSLKKNQQVSFGYKVLEDAVSICMAEDKIIELTCLEVIGMTGGIKPVKSNCVDTQQPMKVEWMKGLIKIYQPNQVIKYPYNRSEWAYLFHTKTMRFLYSCEGELICKAKNGEQNECAETKLQFLKDGTVVYQAEEPGN